MAKSRQPFMPLFFGDFLAATSLWQGEQQALYLLLLAYQWSAGPLPANREELARVVRYEPERFARLWTKVGSKFQPAAGGLVNLRLEEHRRKSAKISSDRSLAGKGGAAAKHGKGAGKPDGKSESNVGDKDAGTSSSKRVANGVAPSHPIPSYSDPIPEISPENPSQDTHTLPLDARAGLTSGSDPPPVPTRAAAVCVAMRAEGLMTANPSHPTLLELIAEGAEVGEFAQAAREAHAGHKGFAYALAIVRNRRAEAARLGATGLQGGLPSKRTATEELLANLNRPRVIDHDA